MDVWHECALLVFPQWVGSPCGLHGPYIFYKAFRFHLEGRARILSLGDFFLVRCKPEDPVCIAELQLLWEERTSKQLLSSSKLYFLPEQTPQGRNVTHGEVRQRVVIFFHYIILARMKVTRAVCVLVHHRKTSDRLFQIWSRMLDEVALRLIIDVWSQRSPSRLVCISSAFIAALRTMPLCEVVTSSVCSFHMIHNSAETELKRFVVALRCVAFCWCF